MRRTLLLFALLLFPIVAFAQDTPAWDRVAQKHGIDAWKKVSHVKFTWQHKVRDLSRSYDWDRKAHRVKVTMNGNTYDIPTSGKGLEGEELGAHKAFINDSYWLLFEFKAVTDDAKKEELPEFPSPFGGNAPAYRVTYPSEGGYTPGDAYVVIIGSDGHAIGWNYYPGGAKLPKLQMLRGGLKTINGVTLPTRFEKPDGTLIIEITGLEIE